MASIAGYEVGKNNPALIAPILSHSEALIEASKSDSIKFNTLVSDAVPLLVSVVKDPVIVAAINGVVTAVNVKVDIDKTNKNTARIQAMVEGFISGLKLAQAGKVSLLEQDDRIAKLKLASIVAGNDADFDLQGFKMDLRDSLEIASAEAAREADYITGLRPR
jgi:hypothetical protein